MAGMDQRHEVPQAEQLEGLRKARDHYNALADHIRGSALEPSESWATHQAREQNARRVAAAYEKSFNIQNALIKGDHKAD
jgi:hypothetical protein